MDLPESVRSLLGSSSGSTDPEERATRLDGGQVVVEGQEQIAIDLPDDTDVDASQIEAALNGNASSIDVRGQAGGDTTVTPVASGTDIHITDSAFDLSNWEYKAYLDDQIVNLMENRVDYNQQTGQWILANDDLIPGILIRLKSLMLGQNGLDVKPSDPDSDADQRLADHLERVYGGDADLDTHVDPGKVMDRILEQNVMNAVFVGRSTDLQHLDVADLSYVKDGETGDEIYIQDATSYTTFDIDEETGEPSVELEHKEDSTALEIGTEVVDVRLYRTPPLQAVADDVVNKMQLKRLQGRKAELASIGGVIIKVNPPAWLDEEDYGNYVRSEDDDFGDDSGRMLELVMAQQIDAALETLEDYQTATVMSIPENWETETIELPEMDESMSSMIRDYNEAISRRLLLPLDLIELKEGPELSRNTMMQMFLDMVAGWQGQVTDTFDQFGAIQADIHGISGEVEHELPAIEAQDEAEIIQLMNFAGLLGLSEAESRELANVLEGVDLETDQTQNMPPEGGPEDPEEREASMQDMMEMRPDQGPEAGDGGDEPQGSAEASGISRREVLASLDSDGDVDLDGQRIEEAAADLSDQGAIRAGQDGDPICWVCGEGAELVNETPPHEFTCDYHGLSPNHVPIGQADIEAAGSFSEGQEVDTPSGMGVVVEVRTEEFDGPDGTEEATSNNPAYVVGVEDGVRVYREDELGSGQIDADVDNPEGELGSDGDEAASALIEAARGDGRFSYPESWEESDTPARLILLKAWAGMNGQFDCGGDCCKGEMLSSGMSEQAANRFCASMKDRVLGGWEGWRKGSASNPIRAAEQIELPTIPEAPNERLKNLWRELVFRGVSSSETLLEIQADWNPAAHPRGPDGRFVERPFEIPDEITGMDTADIVREVAQDDPDFTEKAQGLQIDMEDDLMEVAREAIEKPEAGGDEDGGTTPSTDMDLEQFDESQSESIQSTFQELEERGLLENVDRFTGSVGQDPGDSSAATYDPGPGVMWLDQRYTDENTTAMRSSGQWVSGDLATLIRHETIHAEHYRQAGTGRAERLAASELTGGEQELMEEQVSRYAASNPLEAVAEIGAMKLRGDEIPEDVEQVYQKYDGPEL
jgi:hypothetical protein